MHTRLILPVVAGGAYPQLSIDCKSCPGPNHDLSILPPLQPQAEWTDPPKKLGASSLAFPSYPICWEARSMWEICRGKPCSKTQPSGKWVKENERDVGKDIQKVMHNSAGHWHLRCFPSPTTGIQPPASGPSAHLGRVESSLSQKLLSLYKDWIKYSKVGVFWKFQEESKSGRL